LAKFLSEELGYYVIVSVIAPIKRVRELAREKIKDYVEVYLKADLDLLKKRKPEIYRDKTATFYEEGNPDLILDAGNDIEKNVDKVIAFSHLCLVAACRLLPRRLFLV